MNSGLSIYNQLNDNIECDDLIYNYLFALVSVMVQLDISGYETYDRVWVEIYPKHHYYVFDVVVNQAHNVGHMMITTVGDDLFALPFESR